MRVRLRPSFDSRLHLPHVQKPEPFHRIDGPMRFCGGDQIRRDGPGCRTFRPPSLSCTSSAPTSSPSSPPRPHCCGVAAPRPAQARLVISIVIAGFVSGGKVTRHVSTIVCQRPLRLTAAATCLEANNPSSPCLCIRIIQSRTFERKEQICQTPRTPLLPEIQTPHRTSQALDVFTPLPDPNPYAVS